jgi:IMP cyclohydrolase
MPTHPLSRRIGLNPILNLSVLASTEYFGRGIILGLDTNGNPVLVYCLSGRSENSRNRIIVQDGNRFHTEFADKSKGGDPSLVIYDVMLLDPTLNLFTVSNGKQTTQIHKRMMDGQASFATCLDFFQHEPDEPNLTPRISGQIDLSAPAAAFQLSSLRAGSHVGSHDRQFWTYAQDKMEKGTGMCITTYDGNANEGDSIPSFRGAPFEVPLKGSAAEIASTFWNAMDPRFRVATLAVVIDPDEGPMVELLNLHTAAA